MQTLHFYKAFKTPKEKIDLINTNNMDYLCSNKFLDNTVVETMLICDLLPYVTEVKSSYEDYDGEKIIRETVGLNPGEYFGYNITHDKKKGKVAIYFMDSNHIQRKKKFKKEYLESYKFQREFVGWAFDVKPVYSSTDPEVIQKIQNIVESAYPIDYYDDFHKIDGEIVKKAIISAEGSLPAELLEEDFKDIVLEVQDVA